MTTGDSSQLVSLREAARLIGVHHSTLARAVKRGLLKQAGATPGGWARFRRSDVEALVGAGMTGAGGQAKPEAHDLGPTMTAGDVSSASGGALFHLPEIARRITGADFAAVTLINPDGRVTRMYYSGMSAEQAQAIGRPPQGTGLLGALGPAGRPLRLARLSDDPRSVGFPPGHPPMGSLLGVKVSGNGHHANLYLANGPGGRQFMEHDEQVVNALAEYARLALANEALADRERALRDAAEHDRRSLEAVIQSSGAGVLVIALRGHTVLAVNSSAAQMTGMSLEVGRTLRPVDLPFKVQTPDGRLMPAGDALFSRAVESKQPVTSREFVLDRPDRGRIPVLCSAAPVLGADGVVDSVVLVLQDLSNLKQLERARADFFSMVTHDLKTPVATIKGIAQTAVREASGSPLAFYFDAIDEESDHLTELISNFLDMSRIEAGADILDPETCHIADLVDDAVRRARQGRSGSGRDIQVEISADVPALYADPTQIGRVLDNLVSNGLKYSSGPLRLRAFADGARVITEVTDVGVGIPAENMPDIFSKFFRVKRSDRRGREGAGLGLAICKAIVEAHRGEIGVRSTEREGSTFWFALPADTGQARPPSSSA